MQLPYTCTLGTRGLKAELIFRFSSKGKLLSRSIKAPSVLQLFNCIHFWHGFKALLYRKPLTQDTGKSIRTHSMYSQLCLAWLVIISGYIHCWFFHILLILKSSHSLFHQQLKQTVLVFTTHPFICIFYCRKGCRGSVSGNSKDRVAP